MQYKYIFYANIYFFRGYIKLFMYFLGTYVNLLRVFIINIHLF
jgi:hypothetical protein